MPNTFYAAVGRQIFGPLSRAYGKQLRRAGMQYDPYEWIGGLATLSFLYSVTIVLFMWIVIRLANPILLAAIVLAFLLLVSVSINTWITSRIDDRKNKAEQVLPDAFQIMAANMRSGMTPVAALRATARPEFGPLEDEIKAATSKSLGTASFVDALNQMSENIPSPVFARSVALVASSLKSGGNLPKLLEGIATDIRENQALRQELENSTSLYMLFILFTVTLGTPLLLSISYQFTALITKIGTRTILRSASGQFGSLLNLPFSTSFVANSGIAILAVTGILAAALIGAIREGKETSGLRYAPFILLASLAAYLLLRDYALRFVIRV